MTADPLMKLAGASLPVAPSAPSASSHIASSTEGTLPAAIILGGEANALSVVRSLGRMGVKVYALGERGSAVGSSRFCHWVDVTIEGGTEASWARWLLGPESDHLKGAVVLSCGDAGIRLIAKHRAELLKKFKLDISDPHAQIQMLDKMTTYRNAIAAGVPTPKFWTVESREQVLALKDELIFPLILKPFISHVFEEKFGKKYLFASDFDQVLNALDAVSGTGIDVLLMEWIPGPDARLCSYFTYITEEGKPLFHFTKRIIRRYPTGMGPAVYHITDWIPELIEPSQKLFRHVGLKGLGNIEYKYDERDGIYKIIECNARFVGSNGLVATAGFDLAALVYNRLTNRPLPSLDKFQSGLRLWDPVRDWSAFRELNQLGEMTFMQWVESLAHGQTFNWFSWSDPAPALARALKPLRRKLTR
ncbi:MAG TPA: ATP-grasp domain-containing protein [Tepidisphaeraceae bacterium]|nr:ATP-grasp domain-containing protein [Tepidisphaeraceae bacterium]